MLINDLVVFTQQSDKIDQNAINLWFCTELPKSLTITLFGPFIKSQ